MTQVTFKEGGNMTTLQQLAHAAQQAQRAALLQEMMGNYEAARELRKQERELTEAMLKCK